MVARRDRDGIDIVIVEQLAKVAVLLRAWIFLGSLVETLLIHVAQRGNADVIQFFELRQQLVGSSARADESNVELLVHAFRANRLYEKCGTHGSRLLQERTDDSCLPFDTCPTNLEFSSPVAQTENLLRDDAIHLIDHFKIAGGRRRQQVSEPP